jgi:hypothetical protein
VVSVTDPYGRILGFLYRWIRTQIPELVRAKAVHALDHSATGINPGQETRKVLTLKAYDVQQRDLIIV